MIGTGEYWLVDPNAVKAIEELTQELRKGRQGQPQAVETAKGEYGECNRMTSVRDGVATVSVNGIIQRQGDWYTNYRGLAAVSELCPELAGLVDNPFINAVIMRFNTPGGESTGIAEFAEHISRMRSKKPIVAYCERACSAGYYLASACSEIVLAPMGVLGCIGAIQAIQPDRDGDPIWFVSKQSPKKNADPKSKIGQTEYQAGVDAQAAIFIADVARHRGISKKTVRDNFGRGGNLIGQAAVKAGMADRMGMYEDLHHEFC